MILRHERTWAQYIRGHRRRGRARSTFRDWVFEDGAWVVLAIAVGALFALWLTRGYA